MPEPQVAILAALHAEMSAVASAMQPPRDGAALLLRGGAGPEAAGRSAAELLQRGNPPRLICSTGFCGGLTDDLRVGDIVLASAVMRCADKQTAAVAIAPALLERAAAALRQQGIRHRVGGIVSLSPAITGSEAKRALGRESGAVAVDMESYAIASVAAPRTGVLVVRAVSDGVGDELPAEVGDFISERGDVRTGAVLAYCLRSPRNIGRLWTLRNRSKLAAVALTRAWRALWPVVSSEVSAVRC